MIYALAGNGQRIGASPGVVGYCPTCEEQLIPKCGEINVWHWAHRQNDCDPWYEPESAWHLYWKSLVRPEWCEVRYGCHRADICGNRNIFVELQQSPISPAEVREREDYYRNMIWLFDASQFLDRLAIREKQDYATFKWSHPRKTHYHIRKPLFWDLGETEELVFWIKKIHQNESGERPCAGWGMLMPRSEFIETFLQSVLRKK